MTALDWGVLVGYTVVLLGIGAAATRRQESTDEYFRGSRTLPWWALGISIIATAFSAASLLGGPGEGYSHGFLWLQLQLGDLLGYLVVAALFLPVFVGMDLTTAYEYLERRFDRRTRVLGALCFVGFVSVRLGGLLYGAALVVEQITDLTLAGSILAVGGVAVLYTVAGGIAAVVWTDVLQFAMIFAGVGAAVAVAAGSFEGGLSALVASAAEAGRFQLIDPRWAPGDLRTLPTAVLGYGILAAGVAGTNQQSVQRYVSCADVASARRAVLLSWLTGAVGVAATLFLGALLHAFYQAAGTLPEGTPPDGVFPHFIGTHLPAGFRGVAVAAVFAAAMSSIDSALHSLATSSVVDFYRPALAGLGEKRREAARRLLGAGLEWLAPAQASDEHILRVSRGFTLIWGVAGIVSAFSAAASEKNLLDFMVQYTAYTVGPLLGLFLLGVLFPGATAAGAFRGTLLAIALSVAFKSYDPWGVPGVWYPAVVAPLAVALGLLLSRGRPPRPRVAP